MKKWGLSALLVLCLSAWGCRSMSWLPTMSPRDARNLTASEKDEVQEFEANVAPATSEAELANSVPSIEVPATHPTSPGSSALPPAAQLTISGIEPGGGPVRVAVFHSEIGFPQHEAAAQTLSLKTATKEESCQILAGPNVAVAAYQDLNNDGVLDRSSFGIPTEPYGFSRDAQGQMGPPSFQDAVVTDGEPVKLHLRKLSL